MKNHETEALDLKRRYAEAELFASAPIGTAIASLAIPTIISQIITVIYNMADTFFVGRMGDPDQVAAATVAMPLFMLMTAFANLFGIGGASLISRALGRGERDRASHCAAFCTWSAIFVALIYGIAVYLLRDALLPVLGADAATHAYASDYLFWTVTVGAVPTVLNPMLAHLVRSEGHARQASFGVAFGGLLNMALDPLFIFAFDLKIAGAAIATFLSNAAAVVYFLVYLRRIRETSVIRISPRLYTWGQQIPSEVICVGLPNFLISTMAGISNTTLNHIIAGYSNRAVAGMGIAKRIDLLAFAIAQGMTQGALPLIGYNFSSGDRRRMMDILRRLLISCIAVALLGMAFLMIAATPITRCFIDDAETVAHGRNFLRILTVACPVTMLVFYNLTIFQATGKRLPPILLSLLRKGTIDVALMMLLNRLFGVSGVAWATPIAESITFLTGACFVVPYLKKLKNC